jgi:hypothetical protein
MTFEMDTSKFNFVLRELERKGVATMPQLVRAEAGVVLKTCLVRTKIPNLSKVDQTSRSIAQGVANRMPGMGRRPAPGEGYLTNGLRDPNKAGRVWLRSWRASSGNKFILVYGNGGAPTQNVIGRRTMRKLTAARDVFASNLPDQLAKGRKTIGLAKQSWLQSAQDLGINLVLVKGGGRLSARDLSMAQNASGRTRAYKNGTGRAGGDGVKFTNTIINTLPYARQAKLDRILQSVLTGRVKQFNQLVAKGYIDNMQAVAKAYPNLGLSVTT